MSFGIEIADGVYHVGSILPRYRVQPSASNSNGTAHPALSRLMHSICNSLGAPKSEEASWGSNSQFFIADWHIDCGSSSYMFEDCTEPDGILVRYGANYMLICALTNEEHMGTIIRDPKDKQHQIQAEPWEIYLVRWNVIHCGPQYKEPRVFLRRYLFLPELATRLEREERHRFELKERLLKAIA